ncbi:hypothetical protein [Yoonia maritima]|uniref:hypothetical protein n=1 Tax=Yoonia maritima TaxID=1435347 RepID=UPI00373698E6
MHPPFFIVDHKVGTDIHQPYTERPLKRRTNPEQLQMTPVASGWPPVPFLPKTEEHLQLIRLPSGKMIAARPRLQIVPQPQRNLRHVVGRWLIRLGQRMILENRPG